MSKMPKWMKAIYLYLLSGKSDSRVDDLEVYTDLKGKHWVQPRWTYNYTRREQSVQEFLDGLQDN